MTARIAMANQLRGMLKLFGLHMGSVTMLGKRRERLAVLFTQRPDLGPVCAPLITCIEAHEAQLASLSRLLDARAAADPVCARLMSVPGFRPINALTFKASIEDPGHFAKGADAGAYAGLAPRRSQSGERDYNGRISKAGDAMLRSALYEAANNLLVRGKRPFALQTWGRKLAVLLHQLWQSDTEFCRN